MGRFVTAFLFLILASHANAAWTSLSANEFNLVDPPKKGSDEQAADLKAVLDAQAKRTKNDCDLGGEQYLYSLDNFFGPSSKILTAAQVKKLEPFFDRLFDTADRISATFKGQFKRPRPYDADKKVKPCIFPPGHRNSYPSSHATVGEIGGCVLTELFPEKKDAIQKRAKFVGELRIRVGVHFPTDVKTGQDLADDICEALFALKDFREELDQYRD